MISREKFVGIINRLRNYNDMQNKIQEIMDESVENTERDFCNAGGICIGHETIVVDLLKEMFYDKSDVIGWWIWENDYGRTVDLTSITESDGTPIDVTTPEKFYDYLLNVRESFLSK